MYVCRHLASPVRESSKLGLYSYPDQAADANTIHDNLASIDKMREFIAGDHYLIAPDTARDHVADFIGGWLEERGA